MAKDVTSIITTAEVMSVENNGSADLLAGKGTSNAYYFTEGQSGHDTISSFTARDSILVDHELFDGNRDGIIGLGKNGLLDIDRVSKSKAGWDTVALNGLSDLGLRFLGTADGVSAYAAASTKQTGWIEGTLGDDEFPGDLKKSHTYFYDTALGLNLGSDKIWDWSRGDRLVTTTPLRQPHSDDPYEMLGSLAPIAGINLDDSEGSLPSITYYFGSDPDGPPQGTIVTIYHTSEEIALRLADIVTVDDVTYYFYDGHLTGSG